MDKERFIKRRSEDVEIVEGTIRDMMELELEDTPYYALRDVLRFFKKVMNIEEKI